MALVKRQAQSGVTVEIVRRASGRAKEIRLRNGNTCLSRTISMMVADEERNQYIVTRVLELRKQGRYIIVLSDRRKHLATLREMLEAQLENPEEVGTFAGETTKKGVAKRESERKRPVLLATVRMAEEGFDEARLDTLIFATPKSNITQCGVGSKGSILRNRSPSLWIFSTRMRVERCMACTGQEKSSTRAAGLMYRHYNEYISFSFFLTLNTPRRPFA